LRPDKLGLAALEATLESHRRGTTDEIPSLRMLALTKESIEKRARALIAKLSQTSGMSLSIIDGESVVGGGSGPNVHPATALLAINHPTLSAVELEQRLRLSSPPVVARIADDHVLLDLRTVAEDEEPELLEVLRFLAK
jgi:L-seryl-tRNA(Ser) seleniumtransferase